MQIKTRKAVSTIIFAIGVLCILLSSVFQISNLFYWFTGVISLLYLVGGWYFFEGYYPNGHGKPMFLFFLGYIYAGFFMGSAFASSEIELLRAYFLWAIVLIVVLGLNIILQKEKFNKGLKYFLPEAVIILILSIVQTLVHKL